MEQFGTWGEHERQSGLQMILAVALTMRVIPD
jgi:hypothetical protein